MVEIVSFPYKLPFSLKNVKDASKYNCNITYPT